MLAVAVVMLLAGCGMFTPRPPDIAIGDGTVGDTMRAASNGLVRIIPFVSLAVVVIWAIAFSQPWLPISAGIGASVGLLGLFAVIWVLSVLATWGIYLLALAVVGSAWWQWPRLMAMWRKRQHYSAAVGQIKAGRPGVGVAALAKCGVEAESNGKKVVIGRGLRKRRVKIGKGDPK